MSEEIKELLFLLHNDKLTEAGKRKLEQEIERLKKREQECIKHYLVQCKYASEMESKYISANYVINELEKWLEENRYHIEEYDGVLTYLRKLKGDDK